MGAQNESFPEQDGKRAAIVLCRKRMYLRLAPWLMGTNTQIQTTLFKQKMA